VCGLGCTPSESSLQPRGIGKVKTVWPRLSGWTEPGDLILLTTTESAGPVSRVVRPLGLSVIASLDHGKERKIARWQQWTRFVTSRLPPAKEPLFNVFAFAYAVQTVENSFV